MTTRTSHICNTCGRISDRPAHCPDCHRARVKRRSQTPVQVAHRTPLHRHIKATVLRRDSHLCQIRLAGCTIHATTLDYIVALSNGGPQTIDNAQAACLHCNSSKGAR